MSSCRQPLSPRSQRCSKAVERPVGVGPVEGEEAEREHGVELRVLDVALVGEELGGRERLLAVDLAQRKRRQLGAEALPEVAVGSGREFRRQGQQALGDGDAAGKFGHRVGAVPPGLQRLRRVHDEFALRVGGIVLVEEGQDFARERQGGLAEELAVERVVVVVEHHPAELEAADPFPLVPAAFLELVRALLEGRPAVGLAEDRAPEHDALRVIRAVVAEVEPRAVLAERQQLVGIHAEERALEIEIAGGAEADVGQARVLPPVARTPAAIIGVLLRRRRAAR